MKNQLEPRPEPERKVHLYHCDHRGLPLALISPDNTVAWRAEYDEWGNQLSEGNPEHLEQLIRLPGQQYDEESGLHYNRHRYYSPGQGRYITQDPIGLEGGINVYIYPLDPINFVDPLGLAGNPATATHITYKGIDVCTNKPYIGYASQQGVQSPSEVLSYRYGGNFSRFGGIPPTILYDGYGQQGKNVARGLEQRIFEQGGGLSTTANKQNPVGLNNPNRSSYLNAADEHLNVTNGMAKGLGILSLLDTALHMYSLNSCRYGSVGQCFCALANEIEVGTEAADEQCYGKVY
ncbi:Rhs family protein [Salmonella enterica]|nr:Rhs family protein [Salmonella enterica]EFS9261949.1 Rhs family protein [Salmonella enterica]